MNSAFDALPDFPHLKSRRVRLRGPRLDDALAVFKLFSDAAVMRFWSSAPMTVEAQGEGRIAEMLEAFARREMLNWIIADRDDRPIGTCTLFHFDARHRRAEIGYALCSELWGRGLALEAASLAIDWAFRALALHRIEADIDPGNDASRKLLDRLGFVSESVLRERFFIEDRPTHSEIFGLLAKDWRQRSV